MSAERYEITDAEYYPYINGVSALSATGTAVIGAIRQQASDIAELEVFAEIGRQWNADSSLSKWFPLTAERVEQDAQEIAKLRTDLAAAVAARANMDTDRLEWMNRAEQAESRLAEIEAAPTVATVGGTEYRPHIFWDCNRDKLPPIGTELIARPARERA